MNTKLNAIILYVNRICFGSKFKQAFTEKFHYCPNGLTYHVREINGKYEFIPLIKLYGYEHSFNDGVSDYTDIGDFNVGNTEISNEQSIFMKDYFMKNENEFYRKYMIDSKIY